MKRKIFLKRAVKIVSLVLPLLICIGLLQEYVLVHSDHNRERIVGFYLEDRDSLDVVFIGASEVYSGVAPGYIYQQYGLTSYPFAVQSNSIRNLKSQIKEVYEEQHPKLIVCEVNCATYNDDIQIDKDANFRNYIDNIPLDLNKIELINKEATSDQIEYYAPIVKYHSTWDTVQKNLGWSYTCLLDRLRGYNLLKGMKNKANIYTPTEKLYNDKLSTMTKTTRNISEKAEKYLNEVLEYCQKTDFGDTKIVFTRFPHIINKSVVNRVYRGNKVAEIIKEYGFDFINYETGFAETGLDVNKDFYNQDHLNIYGQKKFSEYMMKDLISRYPKQLQTRELTESQQKEWDEAARYYDAYYKLNDDNMLNLNLKTFAFEDDDDNKKNKSLIQSYCEYFTNYDLLQKYLD